MTTWIWIDIACVVGSVVCIVVLTPSTHGPRSLLAWIGIGFALVSIGSGCLAIGAALARMLR